ncbi:MAG: hypothetical protein IKR96_04540 [Bacteroidales bacterium]|nr:hypothetical protein [Bacteroidales bacterium]
MKHLISTGLMLLVALPLLAQNPLSPEEEAKKLREGIDKEVDRLTDLLDLADWQIFYVDSTLSYNIESMRAEQKVLMAAKVSNTDLYWECTDKWQEATYLQYRKIFDDRQWERYLKSGGAKEKKARDKRAAKAEAALLKAKKQK